MITIGSRQASGLGPVIRSPRTIRKLTNPGSRWARILREHVRHVIFAPNCPKDIVLQVLSVCKSTVNLVAYLVHRRKHNFDSLLDGLPLQRLAMNLGRLLLNHTLLDFTHPVFAHITHLHFNRGDPEQREWPRYSGLASAPRLTHLSFLQHCAAESVFHGALMHCRSLKVLVTLVADAPQGPPTISHDPRFVELPVTNYWTDWEYGARGGEDYWVKAEAVVRERRTTIS
ncbi:hypothetical protein B0H19DRAFT_1116910 [Mycena capillaripes]|nr:hypothetical protein B0H19DRAFT_1116910 [Mycena capillaripes]